MKKGFTLIELLAVLVILVIIMAIATPIILGIIEDARENANLREIDFIIDGAETLFAMSDLGDTELITDGKTNIYNQIELDSGKPKDGVVIMDNDGNVGVAFFLDNKCYKRETFETEVTIDEEIKTKEDCVVPVLPSAMYTMAEFRSDTLSSSLKIKHMIFERGMDMNAYNAATQKWDMSAANNGSVIGYLSNDTLYVQAKGDILAPSNFGYSEGSPFGALSYVETVKFENLDTSQVTTMENLFRNFINLKELDISTFETSNVTNMNGMFASTELTELDLSHFVTEKVTTMKSMFNRCDELYDLDVSSFDIINVTDITSMFRHMDAMRNLDLSSFDFTNVVTYTAALAENSSGLVIYMKSEEDKSRVLRSSAGHVYGLDHYEFIVK